VERAGDIVGFAIDIGQLEPTGKAHRVGRWTTVLIPQVIQNIQDVWSPDEFSFELVEATSSPF
jgi:hypothetical protein